MAPGEDYGAIAPCRSMLAPLRKVKSDFFGDFWHLQYPENHILSPSSEESAPRRKIPGATPGQELRNGFESGGAKLTLYQFFELGPYNK